MKMLAGALLSLALASAVASAYGEVLQPLAQIVSPQGEVEHRKADKPWRALTRNKYLFAGHEVKSGPSGVASVYDFASASSVELQANSWVKVSADGLTIISGGLSKPQPLSAGLSNVIASKFARSEQYTSVRRGAFKEQQACKKSLGTIRNSSISKSFPNIAWQNVCPTFSYRLVINGQVIDIGAQAEGDMITYDASALGEGLHSMRVEFVDEQGQVFRPRKDSQLRRLSDADDAKIIASIKSFGDDPLLSAAMFEDYGLFVASMRVLQRYLDKYPDENEMRPLLVDSYHKLKLYKKRDALARRYHSVNAQQ